MKEGWIDDPRLANVSREKLEHLKALADSTDATDRHKQMQFLTSLVKNPKKLHLNFTKEEFDIMMPVLQEYASPKELALLSQAMRMFQNRSV